jgi:hypothetical protein
MKETKRAASIRTGAHEPRRLVIGISGASGVIYGVAPWSYCGPWTSRRTW